MLLASSEGRTLRHFRVDTRKGPPHSPHFLEATGRLENRRHALTTSGNDLRRSSLRGLSASCHEQHEDSVSPSTRLTGAS